MFAGDIRSPSDEGTGSATSSPATSRADASGRGADVDYLRLDQTAVTRCTAELSAMCATDCIARVSEIASQCSVQSEPWTDPDFDVAGGKMTLPNTVDNGGVEWVSAAAIYDGGGELWLHTRTDEQPRHVEIGRFDSSALFSAVSLLTYTQLQSLVIAYDVYANVYGLRLFINGRWQFILVDGMVGCTRTPGGQLTPVFARSGVAGELWPIILEKAYMKVRGGSSVVPTDTIEDAWRLVSGGVVTEPLTHLSDPDLGPPAVTVVSNIVEQPTAAVAMVRKPESGGSPVPDAGAPSWGPTPFKPAVDIDVVDRVRHTDDGEADGVVVEAHSGTPGRPAKFYLSDQDVDDRTDKVLVFNTIPAHWSTSVLFGTLLTQTSLDLCALTVREDMQCFISVSAWKTYEPTASLAPELARRLRFKLLSMPITEWEHFEGDREALIHRLRNGSVWSRQSSPDGKRDTGSADHLVTEEYVAPPPNHPASTCLSVELSSTRAYFIIPHYQRARRGSGSGFQSVSPPVMTDTTEEAMGYIVQVYANKFCVSLELHDTFSSLIGKAVAEFGMYRPHRKKRLSLVSSRTTSPVDDSWIDVPSSATSSRSASPTPGMSLLQNIRIFVLSEEVAMLMSEAPDVRIKHCRLFRPEGCPIGLTLFSPKGGRGVHIRAIREGSPAGRAHGLKLSDVLIEVNGVATFRYESVPTPGNNVALHRRVWCTHAEVVQLLVRAGNNFSMLVCSEAGFEAIPQEPLPVTASGGCVAIEERGYVKLMPRDKQTPRGRLGFAPSQLVTIGRYREKAMALQEQHTAGNLEDHEYKACLKAALANAYWSANGTG
eukprot:m.107453 g.107453  ORF g.107453 m.107453 type:complete len:826 (-) comp10621_c0_seq1:3531-6008(-)